MKVLITDANILIDLLKTETVGCFFKLKCEVHTTRAVFDECNEDQRRVLNKYSKSGRLSVYTLQVEDDSHVESLLQLHPYLSFADCSVLHVADKLDAVLLTGDRKLKTVAQAGKVEVRGIFWVFDEMLKQKVIEKKEYSLKLAKLKDINRWLPEDEFKKRNE
jgi:predicted nucleic acid-binding protein